MSAELPQVEADALLTMEKHAVSSESIRLPDTGGGITIPLVSADGREAFDFDLSRNRIKLAKQKLQTRVRTVFVLARLDLGGAPHRNPDDEEIPCPHLHLYREGFGDRWAIAVPEDRFRNVGDFWLTIQDFMRYCNITRGPDFERGLFT